MNSPNANSCEAKAPANGLSETAASFASFITMPFACSVAAQATIIKKATTTSTQPTSHPLASLKTVFRKDTLKPSISPDEALASAPVKNGGFFVVPPVIEGK